MKHILLLLTVFLSLASLNCEAQRRTNGQPGLYSGTSTPRSNLGFKDAHYIRTTNGAYYKRIASGWRLLGYLRTVPSPATGDLYPRDSLGQPYDYLIWYQNGAVKDSFSSVAGDSVYAAENGIKIQANTLKMGGQLTEPTLIPLNNQQFRMEGTGEIKLRNRIAGTPYAGEHYSGDAAFGIPGVKGAGSYVADTASNEQWAGIMFAGDLSPLGMSTHSVYLGATALNPSRNETVAILMQNDTADFTSNAAMFIVAEDSTSGVVATLMKSENNDPNGEARVALQTEANSVALAKIELENYVLGMASDTMRIFQGIGLSAERVLYMDDDSILWTPEGRLFRVENPYGKLGVGVDSFYYGSIIGYGVGEGASFAYVDDYWTKLMGVNQSTAFPTPSISMSILDTLGNLTEVKMDSTHEVLLRNLNIISGAISAGISLNDGGVDVTAQTGNQYLSLNNAEGGRWIHSYRGTTDGIGVYSYKDGADLGAGGDFPGNRVFQAKVGDLNQLTNQTSEGMELIMKQDSVSMERTVILRADGFDDNGNTTMNIGVTDSNQATLNLIALNREHGDSARIIMKTKQQTVLEIGGSNVTWDLLGREYTVIGTEGVTFEIDDSVGVRPEVLPGGFLRKNKGNGEVFMGVLDLTNVTGGLLDDASTIGYHGTVPGTHTFSQLMIDENYFTIYVKDSATADQVALDIDPIDGLTYRSTIKPIGDILFEITEDGIVSIGNQTVANHYSLPTTDGTADQILQTDGSGTVDWVGFPESADSATIWAISTTNTLRYCTDCHPSSGGGPEGTLVHRNSTGWRKIY